MKIQNGRGFEQGTDGEDPPLLYRLQVMRRQPVRRVRPMLGPYLMQTGGIACTDRGRGEIEVSIAGFAGSMAHRPHELGGVADVRFGP